MAGYYRSDRDRTRAEVAFSIPDALQGRGIGTRMLERLAEIARERGLHAFDAYVLGDNRRMMDVFLESGFEVSQALEHGVFHVSLLLEPTEEFTERSAERSQKAASASMRPFFEPKVVAVIGASRDPGAHRVGDPAQPARDRLHRHADSRAPGGRDPRGAEGVPDRVGHSRRGRSRGRRRAGRARRRGRGRLHREGRQGARRDHRRLRRNGRGRARARGAARREDPRRRHPDDRPELHGHHQHRSGRRAERDVLAGVPAGRAASRSPRRAARSAWRFSTT